MTEKGGIASSPACGRVPRNDRREDKDGSFQSKTEGAKMQGGWLIKVITMLKPDILDPQGQTIANALRDLGFLVSDNGVRMGKYIQVILTADSQEDAEQQTKKCARNYWLIQS